MGNAFFRSLYTKFPYWKNATLAGRIDHFFGCAHDHGGNRFSGTKFFRDRAMLLVNSASTCRGLHNCSLIKMYGATPAFFDVGKDVSTVAYPSSDYPPMVRPTPTRDLTVYFVG